jgi:glycosyltransferase involved in cell wall biosynthesis
MKIGYLMQLGAEIRQPPYNGPANHVRHVVEELLARNHDVRVLFRLDSQIWISDGLENYRQVHTPATESGIFRLTERLVRGMQARLRLPYLNLFESQRFAAAIQQELSDRDLLYERTSWLGYGGAFAAHRIKIPLILEDNGDHLDDLDAKGIAPQGFQRQIALTLMFRAVHRASFVISSGDGWRERFIERWNFPLEKTITVENGTTLVRQLTRQDLQVFRPIDNRTKPVQIIYLGGFYPWHGVPILLNAFRNALNAQPNMQLVLVGAGDGFSAAQEQVDTLGIQEKVVFAGHQPQEIYAKLLANADIGVSPYCGWAEFSGLKIFDYMAAGLPTIASGKDGKPATLTHGRTGWIVPPCNEEALRDAIVLIASDADRRREMGRAARQDAENRHDWRVTAQKLETIFHQVLTKLSGNL